MYRLTASYNKYIKVAGTTLAILLVAKLRSLECHQIFPCRENLVELGGVEPPTPSLRTRCSPTELQPRVINFIYYNIKKESSKRNNLGLSWGGKNLFN